MIANNLLLFVKVVRGCADMLGDLDEKKGGGGRGDENSSAPLGDLMSTGRERLLASLSSVEDRTYMLSYRRNMMEFLTMIHEKLESLSTSPMFRGLRDNDYIAKQWMKLLMFTLIRRTSALKDIEGIKKWLRYQKYMNSSSMIRAIYETMKYDSSSLNSIGSSSLLSASSNYAFTTTGNDFSDRFHNILYWKFHDLNTNFIACKAWLQHSIRASELSHAAVRVYVDNDNIADPTIRCLNDLMSLARHEYDSIRPQARKIFEKISSHLGYKIVKIIESCLKLLHLPNASYYQTASTLVTLKQNSVMKKVASTVELKIQFINSLVMIQQSAAAINDLDKREKIMLSLTDAISKYTVTWSHSENDLKILHSTIFPSTLSYFLLLNSSSSSSALSSSSSVSSLSSASASSSVPAPPSAASMITLPSVPASSASTSISATTISITPMDVVISPMPSATAVPLATVLTSSNQQQQAISGLRFDTFFGYILLHLTDSSLVSSNDNMKGIWSLVIKFLVDSHGQPLQHVGEALFARLSEITYQYSLRNPTGLSSSEWFSTTKDLLNPSATMANKENTWKGLFLGLARCHPISSHGDEGGNTGSNNPQWSSGIESILTASEYLRIVKTRVFTSKGFEHNLASVYFRKENVAAFYSLVKCGLLDISTPSLLLSFLSLTKNIPTTSESEKRAMNCVSAEFFSGLLRAYYDTSNTSSSNGSSMGNPEMEKVFLTFFLEAVEPLSMDYCRDWEEGLFFALEGNASSQLGPIQIHILELFAQTLKSNNATASLPMEETSVLPGSSSAVPSSSSASSAAAALDEGFSRQGKILMFVIAILNGDCIARVVKKEKNLLVANEILRILTSSESSIIISYRTSRMELASIITTLIDHLSHNNTQTNHQQLLDVLYAKITAEVTNNNNSSSVNDGGGDRMEVVDPTSSTPDVNASDPSISTNAMIGDPSLPMVPKKNLPLRNTIDTVLHMIPKVTQRIPIKYGISTLLAFLPVLIDGVLFTEVEISRNSSDSLLFVSNAIASWNPYACYDGSFTLYQVLVDRLTAFYQSPRYASSWKIKEILLKFSVSLMINNWFLLKENEKKFFKDFYSSGLNDNHLTVREVSSIGMIAYLSYKTPNEMKIIAQTYTRNSETLAAR
jgi:hypothetical protein